MINDNIKKNIKMSNEAFIKISDALSLLKKLEINNNDYETQLWKLKKQCGIFFKYLSKNLEKRVINNAFNKITKNYKNE